MPLKLMALKLQLGNPCLIGSSLSGIGKLELQRPSSQAGALAVIRKCKRPVIPAWMPESSHKDVNLGVAIKPFSNTYATDKLPSMALDSGIHAGMTAMEP